MPLSVDVEVGALNIINVLPEFTTAKYDIPFSGFIVSLSLNTLPIVVASYVWVLPESIIVVVVAAFDFSKFVTLFTIPFTVTLELP